MSDESKRITHINKAEKVINIGSAEDVIIGTKPIICPSCQNQNDPKAKFCPECGTSLLFECPICQAKTYITAKNCSGCGRSVSKIRNEINIAQSIRVGENKEISYTFYTPSGIITVREDLADNEYVVLSEGGITFYKDDTEDAFGNVFLTNRRIIILGSEFEKPRRFTRNYSYPLHQISRIETETKKYLLFRESFVQIIWDGKVRKFCLPERIVKTWASAIYELKQND
jgi:hypothetical protein